MLKYGAYTRLPKPFLGNLESRPVIRFPLISQQADPDGRQRRLSVAKLGAIPAGNEVFATKPWFSRLVAERKTPDSPRKSQVFEPPNAIDLVAKFTARPEFAESERRLLQNGAPKGESDQTTVSGDESQRISLSSLRLRSVDDPPPRRDDG